MSEMQNRDLKYLHGSLEAAQALAILADQAQSERLQGVALSGLHAALIVAEEARQAMRERRAKSISQTEEAAS